MDAHVPHDAIEPVVDKCLHFFLVDEDVGFREQRRQRCGYRAGPLQETAGDYAVLIGLTGAAVAEPISPSSVNAAPNAMDSSELRCMPRSMPSNAWETAIDGNSTVARIRSMVVDEHDQETLRRLQADNAIPISVRNSFEFTDDSTYHTAVSTANEA